MRRPGFTGRENVTGCEKIERGSACGVALRPLIPVVFAIPAFLQSPPPEVWFLPGGGTAPRQAPPADALPPPPPPKPQAPMPAPSSSSPTALPPLPPPEVSPTARRELPRPPSSATDGVVTFADFPSPKPVPETKGNDDVSTSGMGARGLFRVGLGAGTLGPSAQTSLLYDAGYIQPLRFWLLGDGTRWLSTSNSGARLGVGAGGAASLLHGPAPGAAPTLGGDSWIVFAQTPVGIAAGPVDLWFAPRVGVGWASVTLDGHGDRHRGLAWGGELSLSHWHFGAAVGYLSGGIGGGGTTPPGNMGGLYFSMLLGFGG